MAKGKKPSTDQAVDTGPAQPPRLREQYRGEVAAALKEQFGITNPMARPRLEKIVVSVNVGRHLENNKLSPAIKETVTKTLATISGQKPIVIRAKKSVSNFKVREGAETSAMVTIRRDRMWHFLDRLINLSMPRIKDFRGVSTAAFDKDGNYSLGLSEQGVFPEIDMTNTNFTHGMNITLVFAGSTPEKSRFLLEKLGMPFRKKNEGLPGSAR
ncbi:MAG: 50S ribosomal protein L5 [Planctomycetes bacterium HGW-Planctomycetes-2]|nr:MAG: 50S ribosomal protein L5 [Planctomycetes bacterium HGW-Planctomycetes-2]